MSVFCAKLRIRVALVPVVSEVYPEQKRMAGLAREVLLWAVTARRILSAVVRILRRGWVMRGRGIVSAFDCSRGRGGCVEKIRRIFVLMETQDERVCLCAAIAHGLPCASIVLSLKSAGKQRQTRTQKLKRSRSPQKNTSLTRSTPLQYLLHYGTRTLS